MPPITPPSNPAAPAVEASVTARTPARTTDPITRGSLYDIRRLLLNNYYAIYLYYSKFSTKSLLTPYNV
jgi:hypothetical protein